MNYIADDFIFTIDGDEIIADEIDDFLRPYKNESIILEATTLGIVEIFSCCRVFKEVGVKEVKLLYVEPERYKSSISRGGILHKRDFDLSGRVSGYKAVPKATIPLSDTEPQTGVFFLGYEERRLDRAFEDLKMIQSEHCTLVFGVPAFKPGWEMDAFANNIRVIREKNFNGGIKYCGAENPAATFDLLNDIYESLGPGEEMFIAPIGTKPNGIGVALFLSENPKVGMIYDHPIRKAGRSTSKAKWHLFTITFN